MKLSKLICHRKPERSFFIKGHQFPVCARCTGLYMGMLCYIIVCFILNEVYNATELILIGLILVIPTLIDGVTQFFKIRESNNYLRLVTGFIGGFGLGILAINSVVVFKMIYG